MSKNSVPQKIEEIFAHERFVEEHKPATLKSKLALQLIVALSFLLLSVANILAKSYVMLILTALGFLINAVMALVAYRLKNGKVSAYSCIATCSVLFATFVINGGNDGFACLWVVLLPLLSMIIMDFRVGFCASVFFQFFLIAVFWTPLNGKLLYQYNEQFCLRFPLFFFVTFMLGMLLTISLRQAEYNEYLHLQELETLSRFDPLTKLANRRHSFEQLRAHFSEVGASHCIVMGDIDNFKQINDCYGHTFGDEVLVAVSGCITEVLPQDYLKARWGGEEFLLAANAEPAAVYAQVESLRRAISERPLACDGHTIRLTMTFGIAQYTDADKITATINLADERLYIGKANHKNCTVME